MRIVGVEKNDINETELDLNPVVILASIEEIDELIEFLKYVKEDHIIQRDIYKLPCTHNHLQDWKKNFNQENDVDIIVQTEFVKNNK